MKRIDLRFSPCAYGSSDAYQLKNHTENTKMKLIVGLGNPGKEYEATRHNVGFWAVDYLNEKMLKGEKFKLEKKFNVEVAEIKVQKQPLLLVKPQTFMNKSGEAIAKIAKYYQVNPIDIIVVCDDTYLEVGQARVRFGGQSGGHNGLESIISNCGNEFWRVRIGIGDQGVLKLEDYVLQKISSKDRKIVDQIIDITLNDVIDSIVSGNLENKSYKIN